MAIVVAIAPVAAPLAGVAWGEEVRAPGTRYDQDKYHAGGLWTQNYYNDLNSNSRYDPSEPWDDVVHPGWTLAEDRSCWAASAANMLRYVGGPDRYHNWMYVEGVEVGQPHRSFWTEGGWQHEAMQNDAYRADSIGGGWGYLWSIDPTVWVEQQLADGLPVGIALYWDSQHGHAVTVHAIDRTLHTLTISDSDDDDGGDFTTYSYTWDNSTGVWSFPGYISGSTITYVATFDTNDFVGGGGGAGSAWSDPSNWSTGHAPTARELLKINFAGLGTVNLDASATVLRTILRGQTKLNITAAGLLRTQTLYAGDTSQVWVDRGTLQVVGEAVDDGLILVLPGSYVEADWMRVGSREYGAISQTGGDFSTTTNGGLALGDERGVEGAYQVLAGRVYAAQLEVGRRGIGRFSQGGGMVIAPLHLHVGDLAGSVGTYNLSGASSTLQAATEFVGREGTGTFNHYDGSNQCDGNLWIGHYANSRGEYYLHAGTLTSRFMEIGGYEHAVGLFWQYEGENIVTFDLDMGQFSQWSHASYQLDDGALRVGRNEIIGGAGTAVFSQNGGLHDIGGNLTLGATPTSYGAYLIQGGTLDVAEGTIAVGYNGDGLLQLWGGSVIADRLEIYQDGLVQVETSGQLYADLIDLSAGGSLVTAGPNSTIRTNGFNGLGSDLTINGNLGIGWSGGSGTGSLTIGSGQSLRVTSVLYLGDHSTGNVTIADGGSAEIRQARIGDYGAGTLVSSGGTSVVTQTGEFFIGYNGAGASGNLRIEGGQVNGNGHPAFLGYGAGATGTALVDGRTAGWTGLSALYVGGNSSGPQGAGTLELGGRGGRVGVASTLQVWSTGRVEMWSGEINAASFLVQPGGAFVHHNGTLTVDSGIFNPGAVYNYIIDGSAPEHLPTVVLKNGASSMIPNTLLVGNDYQGELRIENGAWVQSLNGRIGWAAGTSDGRVTIDGAHSLWTNSADLEIGTRNRGRMTVANGGIVQNTIGAIGVVSGSSGQVTVSNLGLWQNSGSLYVGGRNGPGGEGTLTIDNAWVTAAQVQVWPQGVIELDGGYLSADTMNLTGGMLCGSGGLSLMDGELSNAGIVSPGQSIGEIALGEGDYVQTIAGTLAIDIGGLSQFDELTVARGSAVLGGALEVSLLPGYEPSVGDAFDIVTAASGLTGRFATELLPAIPGKPGLTWEVAYDDFAGLVTLAVSPIFEADFDEDGDVDSGDLAQWRGGFGAVSGVAHSNGDADMDGDVDGMDFLTWQGQLGSSLGGSILEAAVPEPTSVAMLSLMLLYVMKQGTQRGRQP